MSPDRKTGQAGLDAEIDGLERQIAALQARRAALLHQGGNGEEPGGIPERDQFYKFFQISPDVMVIADPEGAFKQVNPATLKILGYSEDELISRPFIEFVHPEDRQFTQEEMKRQVERGFTQHFVNRYICRDGGTRWFSWNAIYEPAAGVSWGTARDITIQHKARMALRENESKYRLLTESIKDVVWTMDTETMSFTYVSPSVEKLRGYTPQEVMSEPVTAALTPEGAEYVRELTRQRVAALLGGQGEPDDTYYTEEIEQPCKDGSSVWTEVITSYHLNPLSSHVDVLGVTRDISERKRMETRLERESQHYMALLQSSRDAIHILDPRGSLVEWNQSFLDQLGYTQQEASHLNICDWDAKWNAQEALELVHDLMRAPRTIETRHRRKDGVIIDVEITTAGFDMDGARHLYASARDISERKRSEAALRASEARFRLLFVNMQEGFSLQQVLLDGQGQPVDVLVLDANAAFEQHTGIPREQLIGRRVSEAMPRANLGDILAFSHAALDGPPITREYFSKTLGRHLKIHAFSPQRGQFATLVEDITHLRHAEEARRKSDQLYHDMFTKTHAIKLLIDPNSGRIIQANPAAADFYGYSVEQLESMRMEQLSTHTAEEVRLEMERVVHSSRAYLSFRHRLASGAIRDVEIYTGPVELDGRILLHSIIHDITGRRMMEQALRESEQLYHDMFARNLAIKLLVEPETGSIVRANQAAANFYGYSREVLERMLITQINTLSPEETRAEMDKAQAESRAYYVFQHRLASGEIRDVEVYTGPVALNHRVLHYSIIHDVTQRKRTEAELISAHAELVAAHGGLEQRVQERTAELQAANRSLEQVSRMKDDFLASMSHELRTPLTGILGLGDVLQMGTYGKLNEKQTRAIGFIQQSGKHLLELINDILDLSKLGAGKLELQASLFSLDATCQASLQMVASQAAEKHIQANFSSRPSDIILHADERRVRQILLNLLSNAVKFTPGGGQVGIEISQPGQHKEVRIVVWDTGIGIRPEDLPRLFQTFVQLDTRLSREYNGTGLGLALVKQLALLHGGDVRVESVVNQGSRFTVTLPGTWTPA